MLDVTPYIILYNYISSIQETKFMSLIIKWLLFLGLELCILFNKKFSTDYLNQ